MTINAKIPLLSLCTRVIGFKMILRANSSKSFILRRYFSAIRSRIQREAFNWRPNQSFGAISTVDSPCYAAECNNNAKERITDFEHAIKFRLPGQWRPPRYNNNTHPGIAKAVDAFGDSNSRQIFIMQPLHGLALSSESGFLAKFNSKVKTLNSKITMHMQNGLVEDAQKLFEMMPERNTVTWNSMIRGYFKNGLFHDALHLYKQMPIRDLFSYNTVIAGLMGIGDVDSANDIFFSMPYKDIVSWNSMISGYIQGCLMDEALLMFNNMPSKNVVSWNLVIGGLLKCEEFDSAEKLFHEMGERDIVSWTIMMSAYVRVRRIVEARKLFDAMPVRDVQAWNTIIAGYINNGYLDTAQTLFQKMPNRNLNSWREMITGLVNELKFSNALRLFNEMPEKCQKIWNSILMGLTNNGFVEEAHAAVEKSIFDDLVSRTILIIGYFGRGEDQSAVKVFELMRNRDTTAWNATICGLITNGHFEDGLRLFLRMKEFGFPMDESTITSALTICSNLQMLNLGRQAHGQVIKLGFDHLSAVCNALVTMYARCGNVNFALLQFSSMPHHHDVISWNSIISGFAYHGQGEKALEMFNQMRLTDVRPNHITFTALLSACSHGGLVQQGKFYFDLMRYKYYLQPMTEHYTCIIDLLGRFGLIDEALKFLEQMKEDEIEIPASVWGALLGACRMHKNLDVGEFAGERGLELEPQNSGFYMILAEMYLENGRKMDAERTWARMKTNVVKKQPGCSWIDVNNTEHVFLSGNRSHPEFSNICCILDLMLMDMDIDSSSQW